MAPGLNRSSTGITMIFAGKREKGAKKGTDLNGRPVSVNLERVACLLPIQTSIKQQSFPG
jgi:hypothetical protein